MGVALDNLTEAETVDFILSRALRSEGGWMANVNVDILRLLVSDDQARDLFAEASLVLTDGMPLVWAARLQRTPIKARVSGSEAILPLCQAAAGSRVPVYLLGGATGTAEKSAAVLAERYPGLVVRWSSPTLGGKDNDKAMAEIHRFLGHAGPGLVFCAFGTPKQEYLIRELRAAFPALWFIVCGGTLSMLAGDQPKAPAWMAKAGLEWVHRLRLEPRRLVQRYLVHDLPFALRLLGVSLAAGTRKPGG